MSSKLPVSIILFSQFLGSVWLTSAGGLANFSKSCSKQVIEINAPTEFTASNSKLMSKDVLQIVGNYLDPDSAQKMRKISKQWSSVKIYECIFKHDHEMAVYRNVSTDKIIWEAATFKTDKWFWQQNIPKKVVSLLRRNDDTKWNDVFRWIVENWRFHASVENAQNEALLKELLLAVAQNVDAAFTDSGYSLLFIAAIMGDTDSILTLIQRGAYVNGRSYHWTPLMAAAYHGHENAVQLLLDKGANRNPTIFGQNALQIAREKAHIKCVDILQQ